MSNPTTPFSWQMPTATDLVTDLPADFEVFGQAVATSMADLLGGTTGQVLSKASNTDMDFTWVAQDDSNAIQNTIVDGKGDLIAASAADTPARLAVGNNGETLVADSSTSTGLRYQGSQAGGKNAIINGGMDIWQRGTSIAMTAAELFTADRWFVYRGGLVTGGTVSRQTSGVNFTRYGLRLQRDSGNTSTQPLYLNTTLETQDSIGYAGQTITFSFYAKAGANYSGGALSGRVLYGTGTDQRVTSFTGIAVTLSVSATLTTSYQRFQGTATVNASATEIGFDFGYTPTGTASTNDWVEITGVQFELGSIATTFQRAGGTLQGELAACQRYFIRIGGNKIYEVMGLGYTDSTTETYASRTLPVTMRTTPSTTFASASLFRTNQGGGSVATGTGIGQDGNASSPNLVNFYLQYSATGAASRGAAIQANNSTSATMDISAEL